MGATTMPARERPPLLIADGDIPTTHIVARLLRHGFGDVEVRTAERLFGADTANRPVLISRLCHPQYRWLPGYLASRNVRYAYFLDDNFWEMTDAVDPHLARFYMHESVRDTLDAFVAHAGVRIVMSPRLARYIESRSPGVPTGCIVGGFDVARVRALAAAPRAPKPAGEIRVGYPTSRRSNVAHLLAPVVEKVARRHPRRVRFEFVGWVPDALASHPGVSVHPHIADYDRFLAFQLSRQWDIGIAPLMGEPFETYKTNVKYREYGGCGIAGIYSDVPPYADSVVHEATGLLVQNSPDAWVEALETLIGDEPLRARIAEHARADVDENLNQELSSAQLKRLLTGSERAAAPAPADWRAPRP